MTEVKFYDTSWTPPSGLTYSVVAARYGDAWLFVRHNERVTWEIPGGHIEENETADEAAYRELMEETGAIDFTLECVATYSVGKDVEKAYGRLYFASVFRLGPLPDIFEIGEIKIEASLPKNLTYPDIQPLLFERILAHIKNRISL